MSCRSVGRARLVVKVSRLFRADEVEGIDRRRCERSQSPVRTDRRATTTRDGPNGKRWHYYYSAGPAARCDGQRSHVLESDGTDPMGRTTTPLSSTSRRGNGRAINYVSSSWVGNLQSLFVAPMNNPWSVSAYGTKLSSPSYSWETNGGRAMCTDLQPSARADRSLHITAGHRRSPRPTSGFADVSASIRIPCVFIQGRPNG